MYEQTRIFLSRVVPWIEGSYINLHYSVPNTKYDPAKPDNATYNRKQYLNGDPTSSLDDAVNKLAAIMKRSNTLDMYLCMSAQSQTELKTFASGGSKLTAKRGLAFIAGIKSLYLDLDVKPSDLAHGYATQREAFAALGQFLRDSGMAAPTLVVSSGTGGAHVYWVLDQTIQYDEWAPLSNALAEATRRHGFRTDTQCITDGARLLRVPETFNHKQTPALPVVMGHRVQPNDIPLDQIKSILKPYMGAKVVQMPGAKAPPNSLNSELSGGIQTAMARPMDIATVEAECPFVRNGLATGGAGFAQPLWNIATLLASFTMDANGDGRTVAHRLAVGHKGYTPTETNDLYDRKMSERQARNVGWPSCRSVANAGCGDCATCPHNGLGKSPLSFGRPFVSAVATVGVQPSPLGLSPSTIQAAGAQPVNGAATASQLPAGYQTNNLGQICRAVTDPNGVTVMREVSPYPIRSGWLQSNPWVLHFVTRLGNSILETSLSMSLTNIQSKEYTKFLAAQGMVVNKHQTIELQEFLLAWVHTLQNIRDAVVSSSPFGWSLVNSKLDGFVYASRVWSGAGDKPAATPNPVLEEHYKPHGDLQPWKDAADFMTSQKRPALDAILGASFGAPLMRFTGQSGVIMSVWSQQTGIGKSTMMEVAQAVWGHPKKAMQGLTDTQNSVANKAGQLRNLPLLWDELKGEDQKQKFVTLAFQISGGKEKSRLNSDSTQRDPGTWQTMVVAASNDSLQDTIQRQLRTTEAGMVRVFEYEVPVTHNKATHSHGHVSRLISRCHDNYGQAGLVYAKFLGTQHGRIAGEMATLQDMLSTRLGATNDERFWIAAMACIILGAKYSNELSLTTIDEQGLFKFLVQALKVQRDHRAMSQVDVNRPDALGSILANYLAEKATRNTLVTDGVHIAAGRPPLGTQFVIKNETSKLDTIEVRHAVDQKIILLAKTPFMDWLHKRDYSPHTIIDAMAKQWNVTKQTTRHLTAGTAWGHEGFRCFCIQIDYNGTSFSKLMEGGGKP